MEKSLKHLSLQSLRHCLTLLFRDIPDRRQQSKVSHTMHDVVMSGFAMMYFHDPSLLQFQRRLRRDEGRDNLSTIFKVETIPEDTQMRRVLDKIEPRCKIVVRSVCFLQASPALLGRRLNKFPRIFFANKFCRCTNIIFDVGPIPGVAYP
jgi:hypothetical protein